MNKNKLFIASFFSFVMLVLVLSVYFIYQYYSIAKRKEVMVSKKIEAKSPPIEDGECNSNTAEDTEGEVRHGRISRQEQVRMETRNKVCLKTAEEAINDMNVISGKGPIIINGKRFSGETHCEHLKESCDKIAEEEKQKKAEVNKYRYAIVNSCLYDSGKRVFEKNLLLSKLDGEFEPEPGYDKDKEAEISKYPDTLEEWMRFENDGKLYIYMETAAGCGGCIFNGPYLEIDEKNGEVLMRQAKLPSPLNMILSPDMKMAVEVEMSTDAEGKNIYLYDIISRKRVRMIHTVPDDMTVVYDGDGTYPIPDSFEWIDGKTIKITQFKKVTGAERERLIAEGNESLDTQYGAADKPIVIKLER